MCVCVCVYNVYICVCVIDAHTDIYKGGWVGSGTERPPLLGESGINQS